MENIITNENDFNSRMRHQNLDGIQFYTNDENIELLINEDTLFHYTNQETFFKHIVSKKKLKGNNRRNLSDPFEKITPYLDGIMVQNPDNKDNPNSLNTYPLNKQLHEVLDRLYITCFCSNTYYTKNENILDILQGLYYDIREEVDYFLPNYGFLKDRMWDMYANKFNGVCLVFNKNKIEECLKKSNITFKSGNINYFKSYNELYKIWNLNRGNLEHIEEVIKVYLFNKPFDFRDENEYRIVIKKIDSSININDDSICFDIKESLIGLIIGTAQSKCHLSLYDSCYNQFKNLKFILKRQVSQFDPYLSFIDYDKIYFQED